jgi:stage II sporulation protein D
MGMSQWGADGYAQHGWTYTQILTHYYQGTTIQQGPSPTVRVLLDSGRKKATIASTVPWSVTDAAGTKEQLPAGSLVVPASLVVDGKTLVSPLAFSAPQPLEYGARHYRGKIVLVSTGKTMQVVNAVGLESYVRGVVGMEMPSTWPAGALEAQAVAARSYALAELESVVTAGAFDVYDDTRSQVYGGVEGESPSVTSAVQATAKQVVMYDGKVATTFFSSSSGGRTVSAAEALGTPIPYLVSVDDPYDTLSPYHDWGPVLFDASKVGQLLKSQGTLDDLQLTSGPSEHVESVSVVGSKGTTTVTGSEVRAVLGLRSTWFSVGWLSLTKPAAALAYGKSLSLTGNARGVSGPIDVEEKRAGGTWETIDPVTPDASGDFSVDVAPQATTQYRLAVGNIRAAVVTVAVTPTVQAALAANAVQGTVRPALGGAACQLQRQSGTAWTTIASATTDTTGAFAVSASLTAGSYRVRCAPGHGLSPGLSLPLTAQP